MRKYTYRFLLVILTLTTVITTNCSSVDDDTKEPEIPEVKLLPVRIVNEIADKTIELEYNEHNQLVEYQIFHSENISDHIKIFYDDDGDVVAFKDVKKDVMHYYSYNGAKDTVVNSNVYVSELNYDVKHFELDERGRFLSFVNMESIGLVPYEYNPHSECEYTNENLSKYMLTKYPKDGDTGNWVEWKYTSTYKYDDKNAIFSCLKISPWFFQRDLVYSFGYACENIFATMGYSKNNPINENVNATIILLADGSVRRNSDYGWNIAYEYNEYGYPAKAVSQSYGETTGGSEVTIEYMQID